jgi:O-acetyl-ADP-ribose deacetylase (regulator of RNase III)
MLLISSKQSVQNNGNGRSHGKVVVICIANNRIQYVICLCDKIFRQSPGGAKYQKVKVAILQHFPKIPEA